MANWMMGVNRTRIIQLLVSLHRVADKVSFTSEPEFASKRRPMTLDRPVREPEAFRHLFRGSTIS
jgi:hypothetical protein